MNTGIPGIAGGTIDPCTFVKASTVALGGINPVVGNAFLAAGAGDAPIAISQRGTRNVPYGSLDDGHAAIAGENFHRYVHGQTATLRLGGTVTAGDKLKPDASGFGVTATTGNLYGAIAGQSGVTGDLIEVQVDIGTL